MMEGIDNKWLRTEMELNKRHEAILAQREVLLARHKEIARKHEMKTKKLRKQFGNTEARNQKIVQEIEMFEKKMKTPRQEDSTEFDLCKARYWEKLLSELSYL